MIRNILIGVGFAALWSSASVATKLGILSADPLLVANLRFFVAGTLLVGGTHLTQPAARLPHGREWAQLLIFGLLNTTIYLACFVLAMHQVAAGIGSLSTAVGPLIIAVLSAVWLKRTLKWRELAGLFLGLVGVGVATFPLLQNANATPQGLAILMVGIVAVSVASVYYAAQKWALSSTLINGWQVLLGGVVLLPFTLYYADFKNAHFDLRFWGSVLWLAVPVSVGALQLWFYLLRQDAVGASLWLFLCPIFGFIFANILLNEPITGFTVVGTASVMGGLYLAQRKKTTA